MKYALFLGCNIPARLEHYETAVRAICQKLDLALVDVKEFNCCGYPVRNFDHEAFVLSSARNLALAAKKNLNIVSLCKCCFGSLKKARHLMKENSAMRNEINRVLGREGLQFDAEIEVKHLLSVLYHEVGLETIRSKMPHTFKDLKMAVHYGCHALRPSKVMQFDDPVAPVLFDDLVEATGAKSVDWPLKLECCGAPLLGINDDLSTDLTIQKITDGKQTGADYLCVACPWCQMQFDTVQKKMQTQGKGNGLLPSVLYPQLLGLALGVAPQRLGLEMNEIDIGKLEAYLA